MRLPQQEDGTNDIEKSVALLRRGIDLGVNVLDTAYVYIKGTNEVAVGQAIKGYDRSSLYVSTKIPAEDEETTRPGVWRGKLEECLRRLDTGYIDFMHFHSLKWAPFVDHVSVPGRSLDEARQAQAEGLVRHLCFSSHDTTENVIKLIDSGEFAGVLLQYNYLDRHNEPAIARAGERGMGVAIMGPVAGGRLARPAGIVDDQEAQLEVGTAALALRFVWSNPHVSVALSGMSELAHIEENVVTAMQSAAMTGSEEEQINRLVERNQKLADLYCTGCGYCLPCPHDVHIPENFRYMNWYKVWGLEKQAREAYARLGGEQIWTQWAGMIKGVKADECIQCGECEPKCPQNIPIIEQLLEVADTLGS
jgi:predicted aldo/keto reductase-like oxidoreductase